MDRVPDIIAGRYRVLRALGSGGMGTVYEVEHVQTREHLALKLLSAERATPDIVTRFRREARLSMRIASDHVVRIVDADVARELRGKPFLVMELLEGQDLQTALEKRRPFSPADTCDVLEQAASGVERAHAVGIIHRDLKPENLFLHRTRDGHRVVKVLDFGLARDLKAPMLTATGDVIGTPQYSPPEVLKGLKDEIGPPADVWAFGVIAVEMLTGQPYWSEPSVADIVVQVLYYPMRTPSSKWPALSPAFDAWFARSCATAPAARWPSPRVQMEALRAALGA